MKYASERNMDKEDSLQTADKEIAAEKENPVSACPEEGLKDEELDKLGKEIIEQDAEKLYPIMQRWAKAYDNKSPEMSDEEWLKEEFRKELPEKSEEECGKYAAEIVQTISAYDKGMQDINNYCSEGGMKEKWLAKKLAEASTGMAVAEYGNYLAEIDRVLLENNVNMYNTVFTKDGLLNNNPNLHGYVAEQALANSFNREAALTGSSMRAKVLKPEGGYAKNSVDIEIFDGKKVIERDQVKFYKTHEGAAKAFKRGNYIGQGKVVQKGQVEGVAGKFPRSKVKDFIGGERTDGIRSDSFSKKDILKEQHKAQRQRNYETNSWNSYNTRDLAYNLGKQAVYSSAAAAVATAGMDIIYRKFSGDDIDSAETMKLAVTACVDTGAKSATAGALKVAAEKGTISMLPKGLSGSAAGLLACVVVENAKAAYKLATGEISGAQAVDLMGRGTCCAISAWEGMGMGALMAAALVTNPIGTAIAGIAGGIVGSLAGSAVGSMVYKGLKAVGKAAVSVAKTGCRYVGSAVKSAVHAVSSGFKSACSFVRSLF